MLIVDVDAEIGRLDFWLYLVIRTMTVITIQRNVERSNWHLDPLQLFHTLGKPLSQIDATGFDSNKDQVFDTLVLFDNLIGNTGQCPLHARTVNDFMSHEVHSFILIAERKSVSSHQNEETQHLSVPFQPHGTKLKVLNTLIVSVTA